MHERRTDMRERILDVALELFNEQGYEATSLREIAERLEVTKAAIYYHFQSKADILLELHLRMHAVIRDLVDEVDRLYDPGQRLETWADLLDRFVDKMLANRPLFVLHQRNQNAIYEIAGDERHQAEQNHIEEQIRGVLRSAHIPLDDRVRIVWTLGGTLLALLGESALFGAAGVDAVAARVRALARETLFRQGAVSSSAGDAGAT
jgi:AcrR family transcriptional regulator